MKRERTETPFDRQAIVIQTGVDHYVPLHGELVVPPESKGLVLFSHGNGLLKASNVYLSHLLNLAGFATLLLDLLTEEEATFDETTASLRTDFVTLGDRLVDAAIWIEERPHLRALGVGILADDVGASAAFITAARLPQFIQAMVCLSGNLEHVSASAPYVKAATLLVVGDSEPYRALNEEVASTMKSEVRIHLVPGKSSLPDTPSEDLNVTAQAVVDWFGSHLSPVTPSILINTSIS